MLHGFLFFTQNEEELAGIHRLLSDPVAMRTEPDISHRTWVKKTFVLRTFGAAGSVVCHKDKGQSVPQPIASKEQMYFVLKHAHASEGHGGRDKTAKAVKKTHSFIRKGLICLFLEVCPTCRARNDAVKKDKPNHIPSNLGPVSDDRSHLVAWDLPRAESSNHNPHVGLFHDELAGSSMNLINTAGRRPPTLTESGGMVPQLNSTHLRNNTYPQVDMLHGTHHPPPDSALYPLELTSPTIFNPFSVPESRNPQGSLQQPQHVAPFITMNQDIDRLNHHNRLQQDNQLHQQQIQQHQLQLQQHQLHLQQHIQHQLQSQNRQASPSPLLSDSTFQVQPPDDFLYHQHELIPFRPQHLQAHLQDVSGAFHHSSQYSAPAHQPPPLALLHSNNLYDPENVAFLMNQAEVSSRGDDGLLHASSDPHHERVSSTNTTDERFGALVLRDGSVGPQSSNPHSRYNSVNAYQPGSSTALLEIIPHPSDLHFEQADYLGQLAYQHSSGPSTSVSFWTQPDENPHSALTGGTYSSGLEPYVEDQSVEGSGSHQRSSTLPHPQVEGKRPSAFKPMLSFSQHRSGSAPPLALAVLPYRVDQGGCLSAGLAPSGSCEGLESELPRSAPANMSNPMEKSLDDFFARIPSDGPLDEDILQQLLGNASTTGPEVGDLYASDGSLSFSTMMLPGDIS